MTGMEMSVANSVLLHVPVSDGQAFVELLQRGGFFVATYNEPWGGGEITWQGFHVGRGEAIASSSISIWNDAHDLPIANVTTYRHVLRRFCWPRDRRLVRDIIDWLLQNGATRVTKK